MPAEQSIGTLFIADIIPGFFLAAALAVIIIPMARFTPGLVFDLKRHAQHAAERSTARLLTTAEMLAKLVPCWRHLNSDPPCRSNIDPGRIAEFGISNCG